MKSLREIIGALTPEERATLVDAFESMIEAYIIYTPGRFVGVNVENNPNLRIEESQGVWACGTLHTS